MCLVKSPWEWYQNIKCRSYNPLMKIWKILNSRIKIIQTTIHFILYCDKNIYRSFKLFTMRCFLFNYLKNMLLHRLQWKIFRGITHVKSNILKIIMEIHFYFTKPFMYYQDAPRSSKEVKFTFLQIFNNKLLRQLQNLNQSDLWVIYL